MGAAGAGGGGSAASTHWIATLGGSNSDEGYGVAIDSAGNIYTCGATTSPDGSSLDAFVAKYNTNGVIQWQRRLGGASSEYAYSIAVDSNSNVYIAGRTDSQGGGNGDALIAKYNGSGVIQWQRSLGAASTDLANGIAVDSSGNAYIVGTTASQGAGGNDIFVAKYNTSGVIQWQRSLGGASGELGNAIAVDSSGNVYITGYGSTQTAGNIDCIVAKYDTSGVIQWQRRLGGASADYGNGIAVDSSGNVYITGATNSQSAGSSDALIAKYNTSGVIQWQRRLGGASSDNAYRIALDAAGNAYIIGDCNGGDLLLAKYSTSGAIQWQRSLISANTDYGRDVTVDSSGNVYIVGYIYSSATIYDIVIAKLPDDGSKIGTYGNLSYLPTTLTDAATTLTDAATTLTDAARSLTDAARTLTDAATTLTSTTITVGPSPDSNLPLIESVFSTWLYTGTGAVQGIGNGIDLAGKGGMVWIKGRSGTTGHRLTDTTRGATKSLESNSNLAEFTEDTGLNFFTGTGFALSTDTDYNTNGATYTSWTFRETEKFFDVVTYTGTGANRTITHNLGSVPGCIIVKRTDTTGDWQVYHRSLANTEYLVLNSTAAKATGATRWNSTTPTSTVFSLGTDATVNASGGTYVAYLFAHDAGGFGDSGADSVISCGSFTTDGSGNATIDLGWEPQWVLVKSMTAGENWLIYDNMRGWVNGSNDQVLSPSTSGAESSYEARHPLSTGFTFTNGSASTTYVYIAIRRGPMKTPTDATTVFGLRARSGTGANATVTGGQLADSVLIKNRGSAVGDLFAARLTGTGYLDTSTAASEVSAGTTILQANPWDVMDGVKVGTTSTITNASSNTFINYLFRRAPGFFDVVAYTGTGVARTVSHNLGVAPELMIVKLRGILTNNWIIYPNNANAYLQFTNDALISSGALWNSTAPTASVFSVATQSAVNSSGSTYIAYLFASCPGVSKVGSYTGTGTTLSVDCGFTAGARFVLIKRTDSTGDWYVWDTARGIVSGNDSYLLLNSNAAEVTNTDFIDPLSSGFQISSTAPAAINASGGSFIYLAIA